MLSKSVPPSFIYPVIKIGIFTVVTYCFDSDFQTETKHIPVKTRLGGTRLQAPTAPFARWRPALRRAPASSSERSEPREPACRGPSAAIRRAAAGRCAEGRARNYGAARAVLNRHLNAGFMKKMESQTCRAKPFSGYLINY